MEQLFSEDIRDLSQVTEIKQIEVLAEYLISISGSQVNYTTLSKAINCSTDSIIRWIEILNSLYFSFIIRPYYKNIPKSLTKQPKIYLNDWAIIKNNIGAKNENIVAVHLKKAVEFWNDTGAGDFSLHYLRDKNQREVDFLIVKDSTPWFLVEVKSSSSNSISKSLHYFHKLLNFCKNCI